jgi:hypothetical protein
VITKIKNFLIYKGEKNMKFDRFFTAVESVDKFPTYGFSENEFCGTDVEELFSGVMTKRNFFELDETPEDEQYFYQFTQYENEIIPYGEKTLKLFLLIRYPDGIRIIRKKLFVNYTEAQVWLSEKRAKGYAVKVIAKCYATREDVHEMLHTLHW